MSQPSNSENRRVILAEGKHLRLVREGHWEYAERTKATSAVVIVAVTDDRRLLLAEQYRIPVGKRVIELPAGLVGDIEGEETDELEGAARRELLEETGYEAESVHVMAMGPPTSGLATELVALVVARGLKQVAAGGGIESEQIEVHAIPLDRVASWLQEQASRDVLIDPKVYAGLYFAEQT
ncbi:MAG: DNA mismatch repair protein MutT [Planctomycetia bacterium 21-64-5]|nr:MAG: DNA mismatch repair protein MutT [Planctomycetia bacterium 21-64-5]HQU45633.1 NUDIX hydrolase [Pirellulales bacterium]